jgi:hypothetical protein
MGLNLKFDIKNIFNNFLCNFFHFPIDIFKIIVQNTIVLIFGGIAQLARAPALHAGGQGFDSVCLHQILHINFILLIL